MMGKKETKIIIIKIIINKYVKFVTVEMNKKINFFFNITNQFYPRIFSTKNFLAIFVNIFLLFSFCLLSNSRERNFLYICTFNKKHFFPLSMTILSWKDIRCIVVLNFRPFLTRNCTLIVKSHKYCCTIRKQFKNKSQEINK